MHYSSINIHLCDHLNGASVASQVSDELQRVPIEKNIRKGVIYTHDENEELRLVEAIVADYKKELSYKVYSLVSNEMILDGMYETEFHYQVRDMKTGERLNANKKKYKKELKKLEKQLEKSLNSLIR